MFVQLFHFQRFDYSSFSLSVCVCVFFFSIRFWFVQVSSLQFDCHSNGRPENDIFINISKRFFSFFLFLFHLFLSVSVLLCTIFVRCVFVPSFAVIPILFHSATVGHVSKYYGRQKTMMNAKFIKSGSLLLIISSIVQWIFFSLARYFISLVTIRWNHCPCERTRRTERSKYIFYFFLVLSSIILCVSIFLPGKPLLPGMRSRL